MGIYLKYLLLKINYAKGVMLCFFLRQEVLKSINIHITKVTVSYNSDEYITAFTA